MLKSIIAKNFVIFIFSVLYVSAMTDISVSEPAKIFRSLTLEPTILCRNIRIRLPSFFPAHGMKLYAYHDYEDISECNFIISTSSDSNNYGTIVEPVITSIIMISRTRPVIESSRPIRNHRQQIFIKPNIQGTYLTALHGTGGFWEHIVWQQDRLFFHVQSRIHTKQEIINIARSMAREKSIKLKEVDTD